MVPISTLPCGVLQTDLYDLAGHFLGRVDFFWPEFGVVGESDGLEKYRSLPVNPLYLEKLRQEALESAGLIVLRWGWADVRPAETLGRPLELADRRTGTQSPRHPVEVSGLRQPFCSTYHFRAAK